MPKYDYRCGTCGHLYEKREGFDAPSVQACPECSGQARRVLTPPAIGFKGSGWYKTDSRGSEPVSTGSTSSTGSPSSDTKTETKQEAAAAPATEAAAAD